MRYGDLTNTAKYIRSRAVFLNLSWFMAPFRDNQNPWPHTSLIKTSERNMTLIKGLLDCGP